MTYFENEWMDEDHPTVTQYIMQRNFERNFDLSDLQEKFRRVDDREIELEKWELELNDEIGKLEGKKKERDDEEEPRWPEVRGNSSIYYYICPVCGTMIPYSGPIIKCSDGESRRPQELHEWWHKTINCDWYQE